MRVFKRSQTSSTKTGGAAATTNQPLAPFPLALRCPALYHRAEAGAVVPRGWLSVWGRVRLMCHTPGDDNGIGSPGERPSLAAPLMPLRRAPLPHVTYKGLSSLKLTSQKSRDERLPVRAVKGTVFRAEQRHPERQRGGGERRKKQKRRKSYERGQGALAPHAMRRCYRRVCFHSGAWWPCSSWL